VDNLLPRIFPCSLWGGEMKDPGNKVALWCLNVVQGVSMVQAGASVDENVMCEHI